jgi:hypothetical protein
MVVKIRTIAIIILSLFTLNILFAQRDKINPQQITVNSVTLSVYNASADDIANITNTLKKLPSAHIRCIPYIIANNSALNNGGATWWPADKPQERRISISKEAMKKRSNQTINLTLLHEVGHCVDYTLVIAYGNHTALNQYLIDLKYKGHTVSAGEGVAEAYWRYFTNKPIPENIKKILTQSKAWRDLSPIE